MKFGLHNRAGIKIALLFGLTTLAATGLSLANDATKIEAIRAATAKYKDVNAATAAGFIPAADGACISAAAEGLPAELGGMGIHYINPAMLKITATAPRVDGMSTHTDFSNPAILLYEPQADGALKLVGVENLVFQKAWKAAGNAKPPEFAGHAWDTMADKPETAGDEAHQFMPHYDLHVWAFRDNPAGALMPFNPNVNCKSSKS